MVCLYCRIFVLSSGEQMYRVWENERKEGQSGQVAASGKSDDAHEYRWYNQLDKARANISENVVRRATTVTQYPGGGSP